MLLSLWEKRSNRGVGAAIVKGRIVFEEHLADGKRLPGWGRLGFI